MARWTARVDDIADARQTGLIDSIKSIVHRDTPNAKRDKGSTSPKSRHQRDTSAASSSSTGAMPPPAAPHQPAPPSAQNAAYAAFAPEPGSRSEAREFGAANPAAARVSPGLQAGGHSDTAARQRAEQRACDVPLALLTSGSGRGRARRQVPSAQVRGPAEQL